MILDGCGNEALRMLTGSVGPAVSWTIKLKARRHELSHDPVPDPLAVFEAIEAEDPHAATAAMDERLRLALEDMRFAASSGSSCLMEGGGWVAGLKTGLHRFAPVSGGFEHLATVEDLGLGNRLNDGFVDAEARPAAAVALQSGVACPRKLP